MPRLFLRRRVAALAVLAVAGLASDVRASVTGISVTPANPVLGQLVQYAAVQDNQPPPVAQWDWYYQYADAPNMPWIGMGNAGGVSQWENTPGNWNIKVLVTYQPPYGQQPKPPVVFGTKVSIPKADGYILGGPGLNKPCPNGPGYYTITFQLTCGGVQCGPGNIPGTPQEHITNWIVLGVLQADQGWTGVSDQFFLSGSIIYDGKKVWVSPWGSGAQPPYWQDLAAGDTIQTFNQEMRIAYEDPGNPNNILYMNLKPVAGFKTTKFDDTNYITNTTP